MYKDYSELNTRLWILWLSLTLVSLYFIPNLIQGTCSLWEKEAYEVGWGGRANCWGDWATLQLFIWQRFGVAEAYVQVLFELPVSPFYNHYDNKRLSPLWLLWQQRAVYTLQMWWIFNLDLLGWYPYVLLSSDLGRHMLQLVSSPAWLHSAFLQLLATLNSHFIPSDCILHFYSNLWPQV